MLLCFASSSLLTGIILSIRLNFSYALAQSGQCNFYVAKRDGPARRVFLARGCIRSTSKGKLLLKNFHFHQDLNVINFPTFNVGLFTINVFLRYILVLKSQHLILTFILLCLLVGFTTLQDFFTSVMYNKWPHLLLFEVNHSF